MFRLTWVIFRLELYLFAMSLCSFCDPRRLQEHINNLWTYPVADIMIYYKKREPVHAYISTNKYI